MHAAVALGGFRVLARQKPFSRWLMIAFGLFMLFGLDPLECLLVSSSAFWIFNFYLPKLSEEFVVQVNQLVSVQSKMAS